MWLRGESQRCSGIGTGTTSWSPTTKVRREHLVGDQDMAARLAQEEGLEPVPTSDGTHRWVRRESACQVR